MSTYLVTLHQIIEYQCKVEADSEREAKERACETPEIWYEQDSFGPDVMMVEDVSAEE